MILKDIWSIFDSRDRRNIVLLLMATSVGVVLEVLSIGMFLPVISMMSGGEFQNTYPAFYKVLISIIGEDEETQLAALMAIILMVYVIKNIFLGFIIFLQASYSYGLRKTLSMRLFASYMGKPYSFYFGVNTSELIQVITQETTQLTSSVLLPVLYIITELAVICSLIILLIFVTSSDVLVVGVIISAGALLLYMYLREKLKVWGEERLFHESRRLRVVQQALGAIQDVKVFCKESYFKEEFDGHNTSAAILCRNNTFTASLPKLWLEILAIMSLSLLVIYSTSVGGNSTELLSVLALYALSLFRIIPSATKIARSIQTVRFSDVVIKTIKDALKDIDFDNRESVTEENLTSSRIDFKKISFENVSYKYPNSDIYTLKAIRIEISKGQTVGIIGGSGAGKSTILNMLLGLLVPTSGSVNVDKENIIDVLDSWRATIGYVPQKISLLDADIAANIAFGVKEENINPALLHNAIRQANIEQLIQSLPDGVSTIVGEKGIRLSGGQQQRLGIARALYRDPSVLVFDEATSALDNASEREILDTIKSLHGDKTIIMVAHRLTTLKDCELVYRVESGEIVDSGAYEKVIKAVN